MYCRNCGTKLEDQMRFCPLCGLKADPTISNEDYRPEMKQTTDTESHQGKSLWPVRDKRVILGGIVTATVLVLLILVAAISGRGSASKGFDEQVNEGQHDLAMEKEEVPKEMPEIIPPLEDCAPPLIDLSKTIQIDYLDSNGFPHPGYAVGLTGCLAYEIRDFDQDGAEEMLCLELEDQKLEYKDDDSFPDNVSSVVYHMYEYSGGQLSLQASQTSALREIGGADGKIFECYMYEGQKTCIAEYETYQIYSFGDGMGASYGVYSYDGRNFVQELKEEYNGSYFGDMEDIRDTIKQSLRSAGLTNTAEEFAFEEPHISKKDNVKGIFCVYTENSWDGYGNTPPITYHLSAEMSDENSYEIANYGPGELKPGEEGYREILDLYCQAITEEWEMDKLEDRGLDGMMYLLMENSASPLDEFGYMLRDIDENGERELVIGMSDEDSNDGTCFLQALYTIENGKTVVIFDRYYRREYYLTNSDIIYCEGSNSATEMTWEKYRFDAGTKGGLILLEGVFTDSDYKWHHVEHPGPEEYVEEMDSVKISEKEGDAIINAWKAEYAYADYTPFSQYDYQR